MQAMASTPLVCIACAGNATLALRVQECQGPGFAVKGVVAICRCFERAFLANVEGDGYSGQDTGTSNYVTYCFIQGVPLRSIIFMFRCPVQCRP